MGPRLWGIYAISLFLLLTYQNLFEKGLVAFLIQKQEDPTDDEKRVSYAIQVGLGLFCLIFTALILAPLAEGWFGFSELGILVASSGVAGFAYSLRSVPMALLEREMHYLNVGLLEISDIVVFNVVAIGCVLLGLGVQSLAIGNVSRGIVSALIAFFLKEKPGIGWDTQVARRILGFGAPVFGFNLIKVLGSAAEPILLGTLAGPQALAFVQVTITLVNYLASIAAVLTRVSFSALSRVQDQVEQLNELSSASIRVLSRLLIPVVIGLTGTASLWVPWIYGVEWMPLTQTLLIAALPMAAGHVLLSLTAPLFVRGRAAGVVKFLILYEAVYWIACLILVPRLSQLGPTLAFWVCAPLWTLLVHEYKQSCGAPDLGVFIRTLLVGGVVMVVLFIAIESRSWAMVILALAGYSIWWFAISRGILIAGGTFLQRVFRTAISVRSIDR